MRKPSLQALITHYVQAREVSRIAAKWGPSEQSAYALAYKATCDAFDACVECCLAQPSVMETITAFRELEDARTK